MFVAEYYITSPDACSDNGPGPSQEMRVRGTPTYHQQKIKITAICNESHVFFTKFSYTIFLHPHSCIKCWYFKYSEV